MANWRPVFDERPMSVLLVYCTVPDAAHAKMIARALVEEHLAACVNRIAGVESTYAWQGKIVEEAEVLLLIKCTANRFEDLRQRLVELHPYELPEIIGVEVCAGSAPYLDWVRAQSSA